MLSVVFGCVVTAKPALAAFAYDNNSKYPHFKTIQIPTAVNFNTYCVLGLGARIPPESPRVTRGKHSTNHLLAKF